MYGKNNESEFVHSSIETGNLISMKKNKPCVEARIPDPISGAEAS